ncbi:MAG: TonB-dependent receptor [Candidatus Eremiobacteraeota bacterium]|nr:TonB-dependent receptor [Candidatus Eremiobacteraeota bacterium]
MKPLLAACIAASLIAVPTHVLADTTGLVRGIVKDSGKPQAGVALTLTGEGTTLRASSAADGTFVFARVAFGRYTLTAHRAAGADITQIVSIDSGSIVAIALDFTPREIGRVATTNVKGPGSTPVSVNSIGRQQLSALPVNQSLDRVIETLPGIVTFSYNEPVAHGFHGLTYEIDGVPLPLATTSNFSEVIDPRTIDSLEVFTGAFPAEFGGSRQGAVVNILTHRADLQAPETGSLTLGAGSYGDLQASLSESATILGNTRLFFNANEERTNRGIEAPTFVPVHDDSNQSNQFLRTVTSLGKFDTLAFDASNNDAAFAIPINDTFNPNDPLTTPSSTDDVQLEHDQFFNAVYTHDAADGSSYTQIAPWYRYDRVRYLGDVANDLQGGVDGLEQDRHSNFEGLRIDHFHTFGQNAIKIGVDESVENFAGVESIAYDTDAAGNPIPTQIFNDNSAQRGSQFGAYLQDKWTPPKYVSVLGGLRYDHSTGYVSGGQLSPRIEFNAQVDPQDIIHAYYGRLYAAPFIEDTRREADILTGVGTAGEPAYTLAPEHDSYYEFGLAHTFSPGARAPLNFWKRDVRNVLDTTQLANTPIFAVFNNTIGIAKGVEGRVDATYKNGDSLFFSTEFSQSLAGGISGSTFLFPPATGTDPSDVTLSPEDHDQTFNATFGYTKRLGTDRSYFASLEPAYGTGYPVEFENGDGRLPPHLVWNASFGRDAGRGEKRHLGIDATFENFTDTRYLLKINNGFNTTQWGQGFHADLRLTAPF